MQYAHSRETRPNRLKKVSYLLSFEEKKEKNFFPIEDLNLG